MKRAKSQKAPDTLRVLETISQEIQGEVDFSAITTEDINQMVDEYRREQWAARQLKVEAQKPNKRRAA
jgi:hypothetical protein